MADRERPFDDDIMTLIMGIQPEAPGQHGRTQVPGPEKDAVSLIIEIKDMCEEWLMQSGKDGENEDIPSGSEMEAGPEEEPMEAEEGDEEKRR